jgi:hypothetical protein
MSSTKSPADPHTVRGFTHGKTVQFPKARERFGGKNSFVPKCPPPIYPVVPAGLLVQDYNIYFSSIATSGPTTDTTIILTRNNNISTHTVVNIFILPPGYNIYNVESRSTPNFGVCMYSNYIQNTNIAVNGIGGFIDTPFKGGLSNLPGMIAYIYLTEINTGNYVGSCYYTFP